MAQLIVGREAEDTDGLAIDDLLVIGPRVAVQEQENFRHDNHRSDRICFNPEAGISSQDKGSNEVADGQARRHRGQIVQSGFAVAPALF